MEIQTHFNYFVKMSSKELKIIKEMISPSRKHRWHNPDKWWIEGEIILFIQEKLPSTNRSDKPKHSLASMQFYSLYMRNLVKCNPFLPFLLRLVNHCVKGCLDPPCWTWNNTVGPRLSCEKDGQMTQDAYVLSLTCHSYRLSFTSSTE